MNVHSSYPACECKIHDDILQNTTNRITDAANAYGFSDWPVGEEHCVAQMAQVVHVAEEFVVELWEADHWYGAVLVEGARVALEAGREVAQV